MTAMPSCRYIRVYVICQLWEFIVLRLRDSLIIRQLVCPQMATYENFLRAPWKIRKAKSYYHWSIAWIDWYMILSAGIQHSIVAGIFAAVLYNILKGNRSSSEISRTTSLVNCVAHRMKCLSISLTKTEPIKGNVCRCMTEWANA